MKNKTWFLGIYLFPDPRCRGNVHGIQETGHQHYAAVLGIDCAGFHYRTWMAGHVSPCDMVLQFFNVHNLKSLSEEEFYSVDDNYILHMDQFSGDIRKFLQKHRNTTAWILILFGICILWSRFTSLLYLIVPYDLEDYVYNICNNLPQIAIAIGIIVAGIYLLTQQKRNWRKKKIKMSITGNRTVHISK